MASGGLRLDALEVAIFSVGELIYNLQRPATERAFSLARIVPF